jgi:hypothetical protein
LGWLGLLKLDCEGIGFAALPFGCPLDFGSPSAHSSPPCAIETEHTVYSTLLWTPWTFRTLIQSLYAGEQQHLYREWRLSTGFAASCCGVRGRGSPALGAIEFYEELSCKAKCFTGLFHSIVDDANYQHNGSFSTTHSCTPIFNTLPDNSTHYTSPSAPSSRSPPPTQ